jgi:uncharacterized membrane protein
MALIYMVKKKSATNVDNVFILIALIVLNVMFVIHFLIGAIGALIGLSIGSIAVVIAGIVSLIVSIFAPLVPEMMPSVVSHFALIFLSIALICLGGLWMIGNFYLIKYAYKAIVWYVKLNVRAFKKYEP